MNSATERQDIGQIKIARVIDEYTLVINKGQNDGLKIGQRFLVYSYGDEICDPDTNVSLGRLEIVKGTGRIVHLQPAIATIKSDMTAPPSRTIRKMKRTNTWRAIADSLGFDEVEEILPGSAAPFEDPRIGDLVKPV